ncbi:hypothetical protein QZH41_011144 [Actinostola sp. cb2023]|nr:hypothetical protein QZH41_011144 [Actinostola sp. cb2023]
MKGNFTKTSSIYLLSIITSGESYNIPVRIMLQEDYPSSAPIVYVQPTEGMKMAKNIPYLNNRGKVTIAYLDEWKTQVHPDLYKTLHQLCVLFADNPPVWTKKTKSIVKVYEDRSRKANRETQPRKIEEQMQSLSLHATPGASPNTFAQQPRAANESLIPDGTTVPGTKGVNSGTNSVVKRDQNGNKFIPTPNQTVSKQLNSPLSRSRGEGQGFYPFDSSLSIGSAGEFVPSPGDHTDNTINPADGSPDATRPQVLGAAGNASQTSSKQSRTLDVLATYSRKKLIGSGGFAKVVVELGLGPGWRWRCF